MGKTKTQTEVLEAMFDSTGETERLNPDEIANLQAEQEGEVSPPAAKKEVAKEVPKVEETKVEAAVEEVKAEAEEAEEVVVTDDKPLKKLTPAQERIRELNTAKKAAEAEAQDLREKWARLEERQKIAAEQQRTREATEAAQAAAERKRLERPDPNIDSVGADIWDLRERVRMQEIEIKEAKDQVGQRLNAGQQAIEIQALGNAINQDLAHIKSIHPDYDTVAEKLKDMRIAQWKAAGVTDQKAEENVYAEVLELTTNALRAGKSPGSIIYDIARQSGLVAPVEVAKPVVEKPTAVITPKEKLAQIDAGQKVQGFGKGSNPATAEEIDIDTMSSEQIAAMPEDTFLSILQSPQGKRMERRMQALELM